MRKQTVLLKKRPNPPASLGSRPGDREADRLRIAVVTALDQCWDGKLPFTVLEQALRKKQ